MPCALVGGEEVVDDVFAVSSIDAAQPGHSCERQGSHELAHREFEIEVVEFLAG